MKKLFCQQGIIHTLPLLIIIVAVGIISFLLISATAPTNGLFSILNPKPPIRAQAMMGSPFMNNDCGLPNQAFCDTFDTKSPVISRTGQLNPNTWTIAHVNTSSNPDQGMNDTWAASIGFHCKDKSTGFLPPNDYFICGTEFGESNHFMDVLNDDSAYIYNSARILQPFDFANRTGKIIFDVDAKNSGGHGWWIEVWISDEPVPGAHDDTGHINNVKNAVGIFFQDNCGRPSAPEIGAGVTGIGRVEVIKDYVRQNTHTVREVTCFPTEPDMLNHFEIRMNQNHLEVWASDPDKTNFRQVTVVDNMNLNFTRGFVHFQDSHYDAKKAFDSTPYNCEGTGNCIVNTSITYHWDTIGFDGPVLPTPRKFSVPDALQMRDNSHINLGWRFQAGLDGGPLVIPNVDLTGATAAHLYFFIENDCCLNNGDPPATIKYRFNGGSWIVHNNTEANVATETNRLVTIPVALADLKQGTNTLQFGTLTNRGGVISSISLVLDPGDIQPARVSARNGAMTPTPSSTPYCPKASLGDINCNGTVDIFDYSTLVTNFGKSGTGIPGDLNNDGIVNLFDYNILVTNFGK